MSNTRFSKALTPVNIRLEKEVLPIKAYIANVGIHTFIIHKSHLSRVKWCVSEYFTGMQLFQSVDATAKWSFDFLVESYDHWFDKLELGIKTALQMFDEVNP